MKKKITLPLTLLLACALLLGQQAIHATGNSTRPIGDSKVFAAVPFPGYPEGIAVHDGLVYVSGPAAFGVPGNADASKIFAFDIHTGTLVKTITIQGQTRYPKAISCIAFGEDDNLYVADEEQGILKIDVVTGQQTVYAAPFYPVYTSIFNPPAPVLLNDLAFDKHGNLYVTDSFQATIWRVPAGGGAPQVWFQSASIDGPFGPNGVRVDAKSEKLYFTVTFDATGQGYIYTLPLVDHPTASDLKVFHTYTPGAGPDGIAFGKSGNLYVALAGYSQISVIAPDGSEQARFSGPAQNPANPGNPLLWANPANIAFDNKNGSLLVTNHASLTGLPDPSPLFAVFDVYVNDRAGKLFKDDGDD
ncbi:MAG TPA: SMP-30/gluconolactonase/LRE family protein [Pyrinomonadaceae bacterium]